MGGLQSTERSLSVTASKGLSALRAAPDLCCAVNQRLTSVVREIRTLRSVGAGGSAPGDPVDVETELGRGYLGTARRKGRQQTTRTYDHRATSRLYQLWPLHVVGHVNRLYRPETRDACRDTRRWQPSGNRACVTRSGCVGQARKR